MLAETGLSRAPLSALATGAGDFDHAAVARLLAAMQARSNPVKPAMLGIIDRDHFAARAAAHGCEMASFAYKRVTGGGGLPWVLEAAFGWCPDSGQRLLASGVNWSAGIVNPFREIGVDGGSLDSILEQQRVARVEPVLVALHLACPVVSYTDRGKSAVVLPIDRSALVDAVKAVTGRWTKQRKAEERHRSAEASRRDAMVRSRRVTIKEAAYAALPAAYAKASDDGRLPALARQLTYACRPTILDRTGKDHFDDAYFTQTLLPDYIAEHPEITAKWDVVYDARGSFTEPHTGRQVALGTLYVRDYLAKIRSHGSHRLANLPFSINIREGQYSTVGPRHRFSAILFAEKEGFWPLFQAVRLAERYDLSLMSTKGMSVTAARQLVEQVCLLGVPLLVMHDFDKSGFSIIGTLKGDTRRDRFGSGHAARVIDLGLRLEDVEGLESEPMALGDRATARANLRKNGATEAEIRFLAGDQPRRVELNAFTSRGMVECLEGKLEEHGIGKVVPDDAIVADAWQRMAKQAQVQQRIDALLAELDAEGREATPVPEGLRGRIAELQKATPALSWDAALRRIVDGES